MRWRYGQAWNKVALPMAILLWMRVAAAVAVIAFLAWALTRN
jgi:hypothetical protein